MDMEKRGFFFLFVTSALSSVSGAELRGRVLFPPASKVLWGHCFRNRVVLEACVLHRIGVWISATGNRDCAKAGTYRVW